MTALAAAVAVAGGVAWSLCFRAGSALVLPWLALVPLVLALGSRRPVLFGWLHGVSFWMASIPWIVPTLETYGGLARTLSLAAFALLSAYLGAYHAAFAAVGARLWRGSPGLAVLSLPALWVVLEVIETRLLSGFPWNLAAYASVSVPGALPLTAWVGAYGVSFLVLMANVAVACLVVGRRRTTAVVALVAVIAVLGLGEMGRPGSGSDRGSAPRLAVRLLQPDTPIVADPGDPRTLDGYQRLLDLSRQACEPGTLLVWPESAAWPFLYGKSGRVAADLESLAAEGCAVLFNTVSRDDGRYYNSALLHDVDGAVDRYDKIHLVPFGEYVPFASRLPFLRRLARTAGDFSPGEGRPSLEWQGLDLAIAICFEIIFPAEVAERVRQGADAVVTITNDGWYGDTSAPWQHLRAAQFRAAETRLPVLRAALTGVSAVIAADGSVSSWLGVGEEGVLEAALSAGGRGSSLYSRAPWLVPVACSALLGFAILRPSFGRQLRRPRSGQGSAR